MATAPSRSDWLAERKTGIGASDAAAVLGCDPFTSPYQVWAEKVGLIEPPDLSDNERVKWGNRLQRVIGDAFAEDTGRRVWHANPTEVCRLQSLPWLICTPDAYQTAPLNAADDPVNGLLEIKTTNEYRGHDWDAEPPLNYQIQLQHQLAVTGLEWGTICVLIGGQRLRWFDQERNERFIDAMLAQEAAFWALVESRTPPSPDGSEATGRAIAKLYPKDNGEAVALPPDAGFWDRSLGDIKAKIKDLKDTEREIENQLKAAIGSATYGVLPDGSRYSYTQQTRSAYAVPESTFRVLRRLSK